MKDYTIPAYKNYNGYPCPKCGKRMKGPIYHDKNWQYEEHLSWGCPQCFYKIRTKTKDTK